MPKCLKYTSQLFLLLSLLALSACGQKRALYLPKEHKSNQIEKDTKDTTEPSPTGNH